MSIESRNDVLLRAAMEVWPFDREPIRWDVECNIVWALAHGAVGINGYVLIPAEGHPWSAGFPGDDVHDIVEDSLNVHGGITYAQHPWIGFDTGHSGDIWPPEYDPLGICRVGRPTPWDRHWTPILVAEEAKSLARQVAAL